MDPLTSSDLPLYGIRMLLLHQSARKGGSSPPDATLTAVDCSHPTWSKCIDALDGLSIPRGASSQDVYYSYLSIEHFLDEAEHPDDGVVIVGLDASRYLARRAQIADRIVSIFGRPHLSVVPVCGDDEVLTLLLEDLFPLVPLHLHEKSPLSDFNLVLAVLLGVQGSERSFESIDISDWEPASSLHH